MILDFNCLLKDKAAVILDLHPEMTAVIKDLFVKMGAKVSVCKKASEITPADILVSVPPVLKSNDKPNDFVQSGTALFTEALDTVIPQMKENRYGRIVTVVYDLVDSFIPNMSAQSMYSGAVSALTGSIAMDVCKFNIRANTVLAGYEIINGDGGKVDNRPIGRIGTYEDIANAVLFLASDMSEFISGERIPVNGGANAVGHNQSWETYQTWI